MSPYYDFLDAFLLGLKLDTYYEYSQECIDTIIYFVDDTYYFQNNVTLSGSQYDAPFMNLTRMVGGNFSSAWV